MQNNILTLETNKYAIKIENFEGPLDLLCHLIDKNKMNIHEIKISQIADQYIQYLNEMEKLNLDIASEFLLMASTLIYIKSRGLLPTEVEDEKELTEEELIRRIVEYKKYKEISKKFREYYETFSKREYRRTDEIILPKQKIERIYEKELITKTYKDLMERYEQKINVNAENLQRLAVTETVTVASKVKQIFKELTKRPKFVFNKLFSIKKYNKLEVVTAFTGLLELTTRKKVLTEQEKSFGDIIVSKKENK